MANLSQMRRERMLDFLRQLREEHKDSDEKLIAINEIENELTSKKYGLVWEQHEEEVDVQMRKNVPVFTEVKEHEIKADESSDSYNFLLEGDNLHSLKLLEKTHRGRIDVIYIDPPYNTGNRDFIYNDSFVETLDGYRHSKWISFMYERLEIARNLLSKRGILVISIGYQEVHNLMLICNEIFDTKQVTCVTVQTSGGKPNGGFNISQEYIVFVTPADFEPIEIEAAKTTYSSPYHGMNLATFNQVQRPNQAYPIFVDDKGMIQGYGKSLAEKVESGEYVGELADYKFDYSEAPEGTVAVFPVTQKGDPCVWRLIGTRLMSDWKKGYIKVVPINSKTTQNKYTIQYLSGGIIDKIESGEFETFKPREDCPTLEVLEYKTAGATIPTIWLDKSYYTTNGSGQIKEIIGSKDFPYPKPLSLIMDILRRVTDNNSLILDFFAGSATTGHAVLKLNQETNGNRRFILCTNNQNEICERITYTRLLNISKGYTTLSRNEEVLYSKKLSLEDLEKAGEYLGVANDVLNQNYNNHEKVVIEFKDNTIKVVAVDSKGTDIQGIPLNLKYYKTSFIPKTSDDEDYLVSVKLMEHIKEMIQLEHGISVDGTNYIMILSDEEADALESDPERLRKCKGIYMSNDVLLTSSQERLFKGVVLRRIPDYYFEEELREVQELW